MGQQWKHQLVKILLVVSTFGQILAQHYNEDFINFEGLNIPEDNTYPDGLDKRLSKFVRIGRGLSSFIRIGRQSPDEALDFYKTKDTPDAIDNELGDNGNSAFIELEPDIAEKPVKRLSSFVRIGKSYDTDDALLGDQGPFKRAGAFIRMGKFPSSAYLRNRPGRVNGLAPAPYYRRTGRIGHSSFIRIGKRDTSNALRRMLKQNDLYSMKQASFLSPDSNTSKSNNGDTENNKRYLKIGRDLEVFEEGKTNNGDLEDIGDETEHTNNQQPLQDSISENLDQRLSNIVRIGNRYISPSENAFETNDEPGLLSQQKRLSHFVRIGKSNISPDKRISSFVRIGRSENQLSEPSKRWSSSFVRIGKNSNLYDQSAADEIDLNERNYENAKVFDEDRNKRISSFVRIGKSPEKSEHGEKRASSFVRIGKNGDEFGNDIMKRISSFVRIGRNFPSTDSESDVSKRLSSFIRVGKNNLPSDDGYDKRFSSFVRIGKTVPDKLNKRISSFVRIGKNTDGPKNDYRKRLSSFIRVGKDKYQEPGDFENGQSNNMDDIRNDIDKRILSTFVRIGRNVDHAQRSTQENTETAASLRKIQSLTDM